MVNCVGCVDEMRCPLKARAIVEVQPSIFVWACPKEEK